MRRSICLGVVTIVGIFATMTTYEARQERASLTVHDIADNLYMLANAPSVSGMGGGGNTVIFVTDNGVALVDTKIKGYGTSGWDPDAFLLPGVNLAFDRVQYDNFSVVVLNLHRPSALLGFHIGGIIGHKFLRDYRVGFDLADGVVRLTVL